MIARRVDGQLQERQREPTLRRVQRAETGLVRVTSPGLVAPRPAQGQGTCVLISLVNKTTVAQVPSQMTTPD